MNGSFRPAARMLAAVLSLVIVGNVVLMAQTAASQSTRSVGASSLPIGQKLEFLENKGQVRDEQGRPVDAVKFTAQSNNAKLFFMPDRIAHVFISISGPAAEAKKGELIRSADVERTITRYSRVDMELVGANQNVIIRPKDMLPGFTNFFTAAVGPEGVTGVRSYSTIVYENVYPNIDLVFKSRGSSIKAEFIVRPGGDPSLIKMRYTGVERIELTNEGGYRIYTPLGVITEEAPYSFLQSNSPTVEEVPVQFKVEGNVLSFHVPPYDRTKTLVIDPSRDWSTFHGGNANDQIMAVATERSFNPSATQRYIYVCGFTSGGTFPLVSPSQGVYGGGAFDAFIAAYQYGGTRQYSTYFGGGNDDRAYDITADANGNVWVVGQTRSAWWGAPGVNVNNLTGNLFDGFVARFNNTGSVQQFRYIGSTAEDDDDLLYSVAYDGTSIAIGGVSFSSGIATPGAWRTNLGTAIAAGLVGKLAASNLGTLNWLSYYGVDPGRLTFIWGVDFRGTTGDVWIGGSTTCPTTNEIATVGSHNSVYNNNGSNTTGDPNNEDGFVALLSSDGANRLAGTYYGAVQNDRVFDIAADPLDNTAVVAVGRTNSSNTVAQLIANTSGVTVFNSVLNNGTNNTGVNDGFVVRLVYTAGTPGTLTRDWGSYWGSDADDYLNTVAIDDNNVVESASNTVADGRGGKIFVAGTSAIGTFGSYNFDGSFNAGQGAYDVVWSRILRTGTTINVEYSAIYGTTVNDEAWGIAVDNQRNVFIAGASAGGGGVGNMTTTSAAQTSHGGGAYDGFLTKWCNLIVPNAPEYSTNGGSTWNSTVTVCQNLNSSATGFVLTSSPTYPALPNNTDWTTAGSCPSSAVQTVRVRLTNAVQGVQYRLFETTGSVYLSHSSPSQFTIISGANTGADNFSIVATQDGEVVIQITDQTLFNTPGTLTFRWDAFTQTVASSCSEQGVTSNLTVAAAPANDAISQTATFNDVNTASPPGSAFNFYVCRGNNTPTTNTFSVTGGAGLTYAWCVGRYTSHRNPTITLTGQTTNTLNLTIHDPNDTPYLDTLYLRVRIANGNGCAIEYQAALFVLPENDIAANTSNGVNSPGTNPAVLCVDNTGTILNPNPPVPYADANYHHVPPPPPYSPWLGTDSPVSLTQSYTWSTTVSGVGAATLSTTTGPTTTLTGFASGPTANPATLTLTLEENWNAGACSRNTTYTVNVYPQPTASITASATDICETDYVDFTITISPSTVTSGSFAGNLVLTNQSIPTITPQAGVVSGTFTQTGTSFSGDFNSSTIVLRVTSTLVTAPYDAQGTIQLNITSLSNGSLSGCTNTTPFNSPVVNVTQNPNTEDVVTGTFSPGGSPTNPTMTETNMPPALGVTLDPATESPNSPPAANTGIQVDACVYDGTNHYGQEYRYALPEASAAVSTANSNDQFDWQITLPAGVSATVTDANGVVVPPVTVTGPVTFTSIFGGFVSNGIPAGSEYRGIRVQWSHTLPTPQTATLRLVQRNNQAPGTCQTTMTDLQVVIHPLPVINSSQYVWQGAAAGQPQDVCENNTITLTISGLGSNQDVQLYSISITPVNSNVSGYTNPTLLPITQSGSTVTFTINSGTITPTNPAQSAYQEIRLVFATVDNNNCGSVGHTSPILRVWYLPPPTISGPTNVCPAKLTNPNALVNASTGALQVLTNGAPIPFPGPATFSISNLSAFPANPLGPGTQFNWRVLDTSLTPLTVGTDYDVTYTSTAGYSQNQASFSFGKHLAGQTLTIEVRAVLQTPGVCSPGSLVGTFSVTVDSIPNPDIAFNTINNGGNANAIQSLPTAEGGGGGLCSGQTAIYAAEPGNIAYIWAIDQNGANNNSPAWPTPPSIVGPNNGQTVTINWPAFGDVAERWPRLEVKVQNANGCVEADTQTVHILGVLAGASVVQVDNTGPCVYDSEDSHIEAFTLNLNPLPGNPPPFTITSISWSVTPSGVGAVYSTASSYNPPTWGWWLANNTVKDTARFQFSTPGNAQVVATVTLSNGCTQTITSNTFTIYPPPSPQIFGPTSVCHNSTHQYQVTPYISGDSYYWDITPNDPNNVIASPTSHITNITWGGNPNTIYTLRMIQVSAQGCSARVTLDVQVNPNPTPSINGPTTICAGQQYTYTTQDNSPNNSYVWSFTVNSAGASFVSGANTAAATITTTTTGSFTIRVDETVTATSCTGFDTKTVTVVASPTPSISRVSPSGPLGQACIGQTVTYQTAASGNNYQWSVTSGGTITGASTNNSVDIVWTATGTQTITLVETIPGSGCSVTVQQQVNVLSVPTPSISGPAVACSGPDYSYTYQTANNAGSTYLWTLPASVTPLSSTTSPTLTVYFGHPATLTTTYNLQVTEDNGACTGTASLGVTVTATPGPVIAPTSATTPCVGTTINYGLDPTSARIFSGTTTYTWSVTGGTITSASTNDNVDILWTTAGSQTITLVAANGSCSKTVTYNVVVNAGPTVYTVGTTTPTACTNVSNNVTITLSGSQTGVTYTINRSPGGVQGTLTGNGSPLSFTQSVTTAGTYQYTITADDGTCTSTMNGTATVVVNDPPSAGISSGPSDVCSGSTATYAATPTSGVTYAWSVSGTGNSVQSTTANQATILFGMSSGTATVTVVVTDGNGCTGTDSKTVTVNALPLDRPVSISPSSICAAGGVTTNVTSATITVGDNTNPVEANTTYELILSGNVVSSTTTGVTPPATVTFTVGSLSAGTYVYSVRAISSTTPACTTVMTQTATLTVNALPTPAVTGPTAPCVGQTVTYTTANNTGSTYSWSWSPATDFSASGPLNTYQLTGSWSASGTKTVTVVETNTAGCGQSNTLTVTVTPQITTTVSGASAICSGGTATYTATPTSGVTYAWSVSGTGNSVQSTTANQATILFGMSSGTATVTVVVTDGNGCTGTASQNVTVNALPLDRPVSISPSSICAAGGVTTNVTSATITVGDNTNPVDANTTYELILSGNVVSSTTTGAPPPATVTFTVGSLSAGTYVYSVRAISSTTPACTTVMTQTATLTVNALPTPAVTGPTTPCVGQTVTYTTANNTGSTYSWSWSADFSASGPLNTYQLTGSWTASGSKTVTVTETNAAGCGQSNTLNVNVTPAPTPVITASQANPICGGATVTFTTTPAGANSYTWTVGANGTLVSGQGSESIVTTWANSGSSYSSSVSVVVNVGGCTGTATYTVNVNPQATPNITGPTAICTGQSGTYTTPLTTGRTYTWNMLATPPGMSFTSQSGTNLNSITVNWVNTSGSPFVAQLEVVESAAGVCTGRDTIDVTVNPLPNTAITGPTSVCQNQTVTYSHSPALTGHSFAWTVTNAQSWSGQGTGAITVTWGNTNGTVALTVTNNSTGCSANATNSPLAVTVNPNPTPTISGNATPCAGSTQTYSTQPGMTSYQWSITPASAGTILGSSTSSSVTVQWSNTAQPAQLTVQVNNSGCVGSQTINIDIKPIPTPAISGAAQTCPSVDQTYSTPYTAGNSYSWVISYTPGFTITAGSLSSNTVTVRFNSPGASSQTATLTVTETSPFGCQGTATQTVTVQPAPTPVITGNTNVCGYLAQYDGVPINNTETYVVSDANGINYATANIVWTLPFGGGTFTGASSGTGVTTVTVQWDEPTAAATVGRQIAVQVTLGPPTNCSGQTSQNVQVNWNPKPSISGPRQWCDNSPYTANSTVNVSQSGLATYSVQVPVTPVLPSGSSRTYQWTITPPSAGTVVSGQGTPTVQVSWTSNLANTPVNATLSVTETINYLNTNATPTNQFCGITDTFNVVINPIPKPVITSPDGGITGPNGIGPCGRTQYTYQVAADANSTYQWVVSGGTFIGASTGNSVVVEWNDVTAPTAGYVGVTQTFQTPATMCSTYVQEDVTIQVRPTPVVTGPTVLCQETTNGTNIGTYTVQTVIAGRTYQWSATPASLVIATSISGSQGENFTVTWGGNASTPLSAQVTVVETDPVSGCSDQYTLNVTLNPNPTPVITSTTGGLNPNGVCAGSTHIYATQFNAGNSYLWTVTGGTINGASTDNQVTVVWGSAGTGTISVREQVGAMFGSGCWTQVTATITIQPLPNPVIQGPATVCRYTEQSYTVVVPSVNNTYQWAITNGEILSGGSSPTVTVRWWDTPSGTISVTETTPPSQGSCSNTATLNVTINPKPAPVISGPPAPPVCVNSTQTYSTPLNTGNTYQWTVTGGTIVGVATNNTVNVTWTTVGNGTISVKETNPLGCDTTVSRTIPVNALPSVTITPSGPTVICIGQSLTLLATPGFVSYSWNTGETTPNIVVTQSGTYTVTVVDQNGCSNTSNSITVTVQNVPAPQIQASGPTTFCQGGSVTLSVTGTNIQGYAWSNGATTSSITVTTSGSYWCEVTYNNGCKARTEIINVTVVPRPSVSITANGPTTFCEGGSVVLDAGAGFATYAWSDGSQTVGNNRTLTVTQSGTYTVTVTNNIGCSATSQPVTVTVHPKPAPQIQASGPTEFCEGGSVTLDAGAGYASYAWSNGATTRTITVTQQGTYTVTVTDGNNCSGSSQPVIVTVYPRPAKPTITQTGGTLTSSVAAEYQWYYNGQPISGATERSYTLIRGRDQSGNYKVRIRDNNGCENESDEIYIDITPVEIAGDESSVRFVPNPTSGELRIIFGDATMVEHARVVVRNLVGRDMITLDLGSVSGGTTKTLDLGNLPNGVYLIEVTLSDGRIVIGRVTKVD